MGVNPTGPLEPVVELTEYKCYYNVKMAAGEDGCSHCGAGKMWAIVYVEHGQTEETEIGQTFGDRHLADDICDLMNMAYEAGLEGPIANPENDLFSDAMDSAVSHYHSVRHEAMRNAERAGETSDGEKLARRALAAGIKVYLRESGFTVSGVTGT